MKWLRSCSSFKLAAPQYPMPLRRPPTSWSTSAGERSFVGNLAFDSFGHGFAALGAFLRVAIRRAGFHRAERAHAAVGLESASLIQNRFAGRFFGAGEKSADHHRRCARRNCLGDVAGKFDAAVGDDRNARAFGGARGIR